MDQTYSEMEFLRFANCVVSDTPLRKYCEVHSTPVVSLVFMKDFRELPLVGFSICSAQRIVTDNLHPNHTIAYMKWDSPRLPEWTRAPVRKNDYLRIMLRFEEKRLRVRFRLNLSPPSENIYFDYLPNYSKDLYLALASREMFDEPGKSPIAILSTSEMLTWTALKNEQEQAKITEEGRSGMVEPLVDIAPLPGPSAEAGPPMCTWCWERPIGSLLMPCNHAVCCNDCKEIYIKNEREKTKYTPNKSARADVLCPVCRKEIECVAQIWFPDSNRCLLCESDCGTMSAVAGGKFGCGCVIGCYEKAQLLCQSGGCCPNCGKKLDEVLQIFIQGDRDL